jgi:hypothetical protein
MVEHSLARIVVRDPLTENLHPHVAGRAGQNAQETKKTSNDRVLPGKQA